MLVRLQKFLAEAGVASRRASEQIIADGRVSVNGRTVRELGSKIDPAHDTVALDGTRLKTKRKLYLALNKPRGYICSRRDPHTRKIVHDLLPKEWANLHSVGRLDYDSEGLLFLTNDGEFSLHLTHPRYGVRKKYLVMVEGRVEAEMLAPMLRGISHEGERLKAERTRIVTANNSRSVVEIELTEGKNREVRRLFATQGLILERLQRVQIGPIKLGELPSGKWRTLSETEVKSLVAKRPPEPKSGRGEH
jgi:23S rRNA pseudouridine2605 synthase